VLLAALVVLGRLFTMPTPHRAPDSGKGPLALVPTWSGPPPASQDGTLADGTAYVPRIYLDAETSVGIAPTRDARHVRVLLRTNARLTELRRVTATDHPQFDGFTASGDDVLWAESISRTDVPVHTSIWRANWRTGSRPALVTSGTGEADFFQSEYDLVINGGQVYWVAVGAGGSPVTEVRSVPLRGGQVSVKRLPGVYGLSAWPWAVTVSGGRGTPVELVNFSSGQRVKVATSAVEVAACSPQWCRVGVLGPSALGDEGFVRIDLLRPDGTQRRRVAGGEATPATTDVVLIGRFLPLITDRGNGDGTVGLSLYDIASDRTDLVAVGVSNVQARDGVIWWSTGPAEGVTWYAIDLRTLP